MHNRTTLLLALLVFVYSPAHADHYNVPKNPLFLDECGSCHIAYPPQLLDANSWRAIMNGLPKHFGTNASLDPGRRAAITEYLMQNSDSRHASVRPQLRITETPRFVRKHDEVSVAIWKRSSIKSASNCSACHPQAAEGRFSEHDIRIPN